MRFPWLGFIFWVGLFTWLSVIVLVRFLRERERQRTLRAFAESGRGLDGDAFERLFPRQAAANATGSCRPGAKCLARGLVVGGIVVLSAGVGLLIGAQLVGRLEPDALWGMSAGGTIAGCIGLGLIAASVVTRRTAARDDQEQAARGELPQ